MNYIKNKVINIEPELFLCLGDCINLEFTIPKKENGIQLYNEKYQYYFVAQNNNKKRRKYEAIKIVESEENFVVTWVISKNLTNQIGEIVFSFLIEHNTNDSKDFIYSSLPSKIKVYNTLADKNLPLGDLEDINPNSKINGSNLVDNSVSGKKLIFDFLGNGLKVENGLLSLDIKNDDNKFELIDTIVLTEEVQAVERTKEPNGTDYNFKEMLVEVSFPTRDKLENDYSLNVVRANFGLLTYAPYFVSGVIRILHASGIGQLQRIYLYGKIDKQMCLTYSNFGSDGSAYTTNNMAIGGNFGYTTKSSINRFAISTTNPFPVAATPTIKIYGIRA